MGDKSIRDFSAPSAANVATRANLINGDANFELKPALIMMVQASRSVANPMRMQMLTSNTFWRFVAHSPLRE